MAKGRFWTVRAAALGSIVALAGGMWPVESAAGDADDTARIIAGFPVRADKAGKAQTGAPSTYAKEISAHWNLYDSRIGRAMYKWACQELPQADAVTVFYPFSGPDLPSVFQLFPDADRYVMVSIQKAEPPPRLERLSGEELENYLAAFRKAWRFFGVLGFFRSDDLDEVGNALGAGTGMTGALMAFAVRLGFEIEAVEPIKLDPGQMDVIPNNAEGADAWDSVRLRLRKGDRTVLVDYLRLDLSDQWLKRAKGVPDWLDLMAANPTLLKAASHHLQEPDFSMLRDSILRNSTLIVQDETGIEYGALSDKFAVRLYGKFTRPNRAFKQDFQRSLVAAYRGSANAKALPFRMGYDKPEGSAVQVALRTNTTRLPRKCAQAISR